jgi:hypothetical protein
VTADPDQAELAVALVSVSGPGYGADMADVHARLDRLTEDIQAIGDTTLDLLDRADAHDAKLQAMQQTLHVHTGRFAVIEDRLDGIDGRLDAHDRRFDHIDAVLAEVLARLPEQPA